MRNGRDVMDELGDKVESDAQFSDEEKLLLREVLRAYRGWKALGWLFKWVISTLTIISGGLVTYQSLSERLRTWLNG